MGLRLALIVKVVRTVPPRPLPAVPWSVYSRQKWLPCASSALSQHLIFDAITIDFRSCHPADISPLETTKRSFLRAAERSSIMSTTPSGIRVAQTVGITAAGFVAGGTLCISYYAVPSLLLAPNPLIVRQWKKSFDVGKIAHPGIALVSMVAYGYLAYQMKGTLNQHKAEMYGLCWLANAAIWPWTMIVMMPTNKRLFKKHDEIKGVEGNAEISEVGLAKGESAGELIKSWSNMNVVRGCFPLVAAALGAWASLG